MISIGYPHDQGDDINTALEDFLESEMDSLGFSICGDAYAEDDAGNPLRALEFEYGKDVSAADVNKAEQAFMSGKDRAHIDTMVGAITLTFFVSEEGDEEDERPAPTTVGNGDKKMQFFGWCDATDRDGKKHDKIWGVISAQGDWITFWGARGKKLSFKKADDYATGDTLSTLIRSKQKKGYRDTTMEEMNQLDREFETRFEEGLILCLMANSFHKAPAY